VVCRPHGFELPKSLGGLIQKIDIHRTKKCSKPSFPHVSAFKLAAKRKASPPELFPSRHIEAARLPFRARVLVTGGVHGRPKLALMQWRTPDYDTNCRETNRGIVGCNRCRRRRGRCADPHVGGARRCTGAVSHFTMGRFGRVRYDLQIGAGLYLCCIAVMASAVGGYLAARLRTKWTGIHNNEVFFRDTAHGLLAWALANAADRRGARIGDSPYRERWPARSGWCGRVRAEQNSNPAENLRRSTLFRVGSRRLQMLLALSLRTPHAPKFCGLWTTSFSERNDLTTEDRTYVARLISARTGINQADAERRVNDVVAEAKAAADKARKAWATALGSG